MIVYEVNLAVDAAIAGEYHGWLRAHMREIVALRGFVSAELFAVREPIPGPDQRAWCVQYRLRDETALADYLRDHAPRLRADGLARFGGRFTATRRILEVEPDAAG